MTRPLRLEFPGALYHVKLGAGEQFLADSGLLDVAVRWFDLATAVVAQHVPQAWYVDLDVPPSLV